MIGSDVAQSLSQEVPLSETANQQPNNNHMDSNANATEANAAETDNSAMRVSFVVENPESHIEDKTVASFCQLLAVGKDNRQQQQPEHTDGDTVAAHSNSSSLSSSSSIQSQSNTDANMQSDLPPPNNNDIKDDASDDCSWKEPEEDDDKEEDFFKYGSKRWPTAINEFTASEMILTTAFPHVFILGNAYKRAAGKMKEKHLKHLLHQFHKVPSTD